jgi:exodeoxyribonuclease VII large subunit
VSELARRVRQSIELAHPLLWVAGEISSFTRATSGHWYFSLKDSTAQLRCAMFRGRNQWVDWQPRNGDAVEARAVPTLYEARGEFQLVVEQLRPAGQGALFEAFVRLKARLEAEGLFDPTHKRALPPFPRAIGVVTSPAAAAWRDVVTTLRRRAPHIPVILYPASVQGQDAPGRLLQALRMATARAEVDVVIVCRGGGSIEDLWAFNDEALARAIATCPVPVVSGVGHETDFTIADFAADLRAPTPTAAAELCAPQRAQLQGELASLQQRMVRFAWHQVDRLQSLLASARQRLSHAARRRLEERAWQLDRLATRLVHPGAQLALGSGQLAQLGERMQRAARQQLADQQRSHQAAQRALHSAWLHRAHAEQQHLASLMHALQLLDPGQVLARGYSLAYGPAGELLRAPEQVAPGDAIAVVLAGGRIAATVKSH